MAKIRRRAYSPRTEEQRDPKYGKRAVAQTGDSKRAYQEKKAKKSKKP